MLILLKLNRISFAFKFSAQLFIPEFNPDLLCNLLRCQRTQLWVQRPVPFPCSGATAPGPPWWAVPPQGRRHPTSSILQLLTGPCLQPFPSVSGPSFSPPSPRGRRLPLRCRRTRTPLFQPDQSSWPSPEPGLSDSIRVALCLPLYLPKEEVVVEEEVEEEGMCFVAMCIDCIYLTGMDSTVCKYLSPLSLMFSLFVVEILHQRTSCRLQINRLQCQRHAEETDQ